MEKFLYERPIKKDIKMNAIFAFPAIESFAMSSIGYLSIFKDIDKMEKVFVERYYTNSNTTITQIKDVDVIGFSFSFEMDIFQIIKILEKFKIPLLKSERNESHPLIFAGGPVITSNPLPFREFFDFVNIADANVCKIFDTLIKKNSDEKNEKLRAIKDIAGVWVTGEKYDRKIERVVENIDSPTATPILSDKSYFRDTFIIEIARGCPKMCNFCLASWHNLPFRQSKTDKIIQNIENALLYTNKIALLGACVAGHNDFEKIMKFISEKNKINPIELSISSLRADLVSPNTVKTLVECGAKTATIAVETGSERLRKVINKDLTNEQIKNTVKCARENGLKGIKIYMMIGLPTETQEDIEEIVTLMKKLKSENKGFEISVSLNTLIPKPHTPFQYERRENKKSLEKKIKYLKKNFHMAGIKLNTTSADWDGVQSLLSRFGDTMAEYLIDVHTTGAKLGSFKTSWKNFQKKFKLPSFDEAVENPLCENISNIHKMPWDFLHITNEDALKATYRKFIEIS